MVAIGQKGISINCYQFVYIPVTYRIKAIFPNGTRLMVNYLPETEKAEK